MKNSKMMKMARPFTLITKRGYVVRFIRNKPTIVPDSVVEEAIERGAGFCGEDESYVPGVTVEEATKPVYGPERKALLLKVCRAMKEKNAPDDFTATGAPKLKAVMEAAGFELDRSEINIAWTELQKKDAD
ncbi:MAG: hypothetical protein DRI46_12500 [Chloroflexi bacterium]|nr:MAG: hypothetical protein DRI46_12500 [Chloroflexota bacterium]